MPIRLTLEFPGETPESKAITFTCDSGDYDPGPELNAAWGQVSRRLATYCDGELLARIWREDV